MKWSKKVLVVLMVLVLCFASFSGMFFGKSEKIETAKAIATTVSYNRDAAVSFAANYWDEVCPDGFYATTSNCDPSDCAHFVSYALKMGGIPMGNLKMASCGKTYYGYLGSMDLSRYLYNDGYASKLTEIPVAGSSTWKTDIVDFLSAHNGDQYKGDILFFVYTDGVHAHTVLYLGNYTSDRSHGAIAQHSYGNTFSIPSTSNCYGCTTGWGSYDNRNYGPIAFIEDMGYSNIDHFSYYHINTGTVSPPSAPSLIAPPNGSTVTTTTPTFQWGNVSNADKYGLWIGRTSDQTEVYSNYNITATSFQIPSGYLLNGVSYYWSVKAYNSAGWGDYAGSWTFTVNTTQPPSAPQNLTATPGDSQVTLQWNAPSSNGGASITGYRIYRGTSSGNETYYAAVGVRYDYINTGLTNGTRYYYKVSAVNSVGEGPKSIEAYATPQATTTSTARIEIDHTYRGDLYVELGVGDPSSPLWHTVVSNYEGGSADNIYTTVDISSASAYLPPSSSNRWYLKVYDDASGDTGTIKTFYITYNGTTYTSTDPPVPINDYQTSYAYIPSSSSTLTVNVTGPSSGYTNTNYTFTASASGGTGSYSYSWSSDGLASHSGNSATYNWSTSGTKTVTCTVTSGSETAPGSATISISTPAPSDFTLSTNVSPSGSGTIMLNPPGGTYSAGTVVTLTANPSTGYHFVSWGGDASGTSTTTTVTMNSNKSVTANFAINTYTITASASTGGIISPSGSVVVNYGANQTFTITPNSGYQISNVLVDGASQGAIQTYTFYNVTANHTISASFSALPPSLDHFEFAQIPNQTAGVPFNIAITAKDQYGNTYTSFNSTVTLSVNKGTIITSTTTPNFVSGVLSNFQVTIPDANTGVTITATSSGKTGTSNAFDVSDADTGGMQYANWYFGQNNLKEVNVIIEINNDPATEDGLYFQAYDGYINGQMFYFGLQTEVGKPGSGLIGKGLIFSEFGTTDASNIRIASNGWYEVGTYEGPFISTRLGYNWTNHKYALTIKYKESDTIGDWYEFWIEDLTTNTNTYAGALRFPFPKDPSKKGITDYGGSWTELYYRAVQGSSLPQWSISILEVSAISKDGNLLFPKTAHLKNADNFYHIDQAFHPENNCLDFIIGGSATKSFNEKNITLSSGTIKVNATLNGDPWNGTLNFTLKREKPYGYAAAIPLNLSGYPVGTYTIQYISSGPKNATLLSIVPSPTQSLTSQGTITFTMNFTAQSINPSAPSNLQATSTTNSITLTWDASTQGKYPIAGYAVYRGTESGKEDLSKPIATVDANTTTYTDKDVQCGTMYYYYVEAYDNQNPPNYSEPSNEASANTGTYTITATAGFGGSITPSGVVTLSYGGSQTFQIYPDTGYLIKDVLIDGVSIKTGRPNPQPMTSVKFTFSNITSNHTIEASFEKQITQTVIILQIGKSSFTVNGMPNTLDSPPVIKNGRTLLPIRAVIESLNGSVGWDATTKKVTVTLGSNTIELWIDKPQAEVNGETKWIDSNNHDVRPIIVNSRTMLPLRFVAESLGCTVNWDPDTRKITITYGG